MTAVATEDFLSHYGIPGMKWGKRKGSSSKSSPKEAPSADAKAVGALVGRKKTSGTAALSNKELQQVITRKQLEQQYATLNPSKVQAGNNKVKSILGIVGTVGAVYALGSSPMGKGVKSAIGKAIRS